MAVHKLSEEPIAPDLHAVQPNREDFPTQPTPPGRDAERDARNVAALVQATATTMALARIVSARLILLLAAIGAFILAMYAVQAASWPALLTMALYDLLVIVPLVLLESGLLAKLKG